MYWQSFSQLPYLDRSWIVCLFHRYQLFNASPILNIPCLIVAYSTVFHLSLLPTFQGLFLLFIALPRSESARAMHRITSGFMLYSFPASMKSWGSCQYSLANASREGSTFGRAFACQLLFVLNSIFCGISTWRYSHHHVITSHP
jgi:hypothetical protein